MQRPEIKKGDSFTLLALANTVMSQIVAQVVVCKQSIENKLTIDLNCLSEELCGYNIIPTQLDKIALKTGHVSGE